MEPFLRYINWDKNNICCMLLSFLIYGAYFKNIGSFRILSVSNESYLTPLFPFLGLIDSSFWSNIKIARRSKSRDPSEMKECPICRVWTNKKNFARHMHVHSDFRAFRCKVCNKGFKTKLNLLRHESIHSRDTLQPCQYGEIDKRL